MKKIEIMEAGQPCFFPPQVSLGDSHIPKIENHAYGALLGSTYYATSSLSLINALSPSYYIKHNSTRQLESSTGGRTKLFYDQLLEWVSQSKW